MCDNHRRKRHYTTYFFPSPPPNISINRLDFLTVCFLTRRLTLLYKRVQASHKKKSAVFFTFLDLVYHLRSTPAPALSHLRGGVTEHAHLCPPYTLRCAPPCLSRDDLSIFFPRGLGRMGSQPTRQHRVPEMRQQCMATNQCECQIPD